MISNVPADYLKDPFEKGGGAKFYADILSSLGLASYGVTVRPFAQQGMMGDYVDAPQTQYTNFKGLYASAAALLNSKSFFHGTLTCTVFINSVPVSGAAAGFILTPSGPQQSFQFPFVQYSNTSTPDGVTFTQNNFRTFDSVFFQGLYLELDSAQMYMYYNFNGVEIFY